MSSQLRPHQKALLVATAITVAAWFVPILNLALLPIRYLNTHLHELCHALAALATGGTPQKIMVFEDGSGKTPVLGGMILIVASAGYVGASAIGAWLIATGREERKARTVLGILSAVLAISMVLWVRGDMAGVFSGGFWVLALALGSLKLRGSWAIFAAQFLGVQQCLNAFLSLLGLLRISMVYEGQSDATILQQATGLPAMFWAGGWCAVSLVLVILALKRAWRSTE